MHALPATRRGGCCPGMRTNRPPGRPPQPGARSSLGPQEKSDIQLPRPPSWSSMLSAQAASTPFCLFQLPYLKTNGVAGRELASVAVASTYGPPSTAASIMQSSMQPWRRHRKWQPVR